MNFFKEKNIRKALGNLIYREIRQNINELHIKTIKDNYFKLILEIINRFLDEFFSKKLFWRSSKNIEKTYNKKTKLWIMDE